MEFEGVVVKILPQVKGTSPRGEWIKQEVIFEQPGEFGRKVCVSFWGDKAEDAASLREGDAVKVSANVESREHNGRWYTEVRAWKIAANAGGNAGSAPAGRGTGASSGGANAWQGSAGGSAAGGFAAGGSGRGGGFAAAAAGMPISSSEEPAREEFDDLPF